MMKYLLSVVEKHIPLMLHKSFFFLRQMAVMIFKRGVFESRRKNKSFFRPKIRANIKEAQTVSLRISSVFQTTSAVFIFYLCL